MVEAISCLAKLTQSSHFTFCGTLLSFVRFPVYNTRHFSTLFSIMVKALPWPWFISISRYKYHLLYSLTRSTYAHKNYKKRQQIHIIQCLSQPYTQYKKFYVLIHTSEYLIPDNDQQQPPQRKSRKPTTTSNLLLLRATQTTRKATKK